MAVVYLVQDLKHRRRVALKVLRDDLSAVLGAARFHREIEIAAGLQHPHILPLYDSGEAAGTLYYVMPYIEGESLRVKLARDGKLPIDDALRVTLETADALAYAHSCGIIHRDIKPENILLSGGHAVVADFGIARAISNAGMQTLTDVGFILGTPAYMAPEQASGGDVVDARADIYALGCVLYECLTGKPPFSGGSAQAILARQITESPAEVSATRTGVPELVRGVLRRALMKSPGARFQTSGEFLAALEPATRSGAHRSRPLSALGARRGWRGIGGIVGVMLAVAGGAFALMRHRDTAIAASTDRIRSIAVIPLVNQSSDRENEYFSDGMTEELIAALSNVEGLRVAPRSSSFAFKGKNRSSSDIGRELHVDAVIDGSVQRSGGQLQLRAQLVRVANDSVLWTDGYRRQVADVFTLQDELTSAILARLRPALSGSAPAARSRHATRDPEAYDLYLQGRFYLVRRERDGLLKAADYFQGAVARDRDASARARQHKRRGTHVPRLHRALP
ncbi:MAG: protein kinase [Gemmatimonadetes bacterium]|nr:protein kinase [Gemmatimonadota bacterium]